MISDIIANYLASETRLIIPEVGAFIRRKDSNMVVFMEILKKNDGVLCSLVEQAEGISAEAAAAEVEKYVSEIKTQLATNRKFIIDSVGVLILSNNDTVDFTYNPFARAIPVFETQAPQLKNIEPEELQQPVAKPSQHSSAQIATAHKTEIENDEEDGDESALAYLQKVKARKIDIRTHHKRKKLDPITLLAILVVLLALVSLIWGAMPNRVTLDVDTSVEQTEETTDK